MHENEPASAAESVLERSAPGRMTVSTTAFDAVLEANAGLCIWTTRGYASEDRCESLTLTVDVAPWTPPGPSSLIPMNSAPRSLAGSTADSCDNLGISHPSTRTPPASLHVT